MPVGEHFGPGILGEFMLILFAFERTYLGAENRSFK